MTVAERRRRRASQRLGIVAILASGSGMLGAVVLSSADPASAGFTAAAATVSIGIGALGIAEVAPLRVVGAAAIAAGLIVLLSGLIPEELDDLEICRLIAGVVLVVAAAPLMSRVPEAPAGARYRA